MKNIKKNKEEKVDHKSQEDEWKNKYLRALADYQNLEKRTISQIQDSKKRANKDLLLKFLEVLDDIYAAEVFVKDTGLKLIKDKFIKILQSESVSQMELIDKAYDPHLAECTEIVPGKRDNIIIEEVRKGYKLYDEVLRVARVKVEKKVN